MPTNKNATLRYRILDALFRHPEGYEMPDLIKAVNERLIDYGYSVKERQIRDDIRIMKSEPPLGWAAPIKCAYKHYKYEDHSFRLTDRDLTTADRNGIKEAISVLRQFEGLPLFVPLERYLTRIESHYLTNDKLPYPHVMFDTNPKTVGLNWLPEALTAIKNESVLTFDFRPFEAAATSKIVHPYLIREFNNRWFLFGRNDYDNQLAWFTFDRIFDLETVSNMPYKPNDIFDPNSHFLDFVGITKPDNGILTLITLEADALRAKYMRTKPLHHSLQEIGTTPEGNIRFTVQLMPNFEFYALIASMAHNLRIVAPEHVRQELLKRLQDAIAFQTSNSNG